MSCEMLENEDFELEIKILEILKRGRPEVDFESSSDMVLDGLIDSFEIVMLTTEFEKSFGVNIPGEDIIPESFATIAAMAKLVRKLQVRD